ncbi:hypothetical protein METH_08750 [Leisingera methylohalidivorans DSM 14336]|uniref:Uncharacterized protein n=1 Tax=Leisingera methylohalidivorans DSM 14336 TaxID=999552 RepID=V9VW87_9RHOB|nr:hypothetical protein METH_08750 [Leisingera methylohalidivorans DSM 14336]
MKFLLLLALLEAAASTAELSRESYAGSNE